MRYLLDTCVLIYAIDDREKLNSAIDDILFDYNNQIYVSAESIKELIVLYRHKHMFNKRWKTEKEMVKSITDDYCFQIRPVTEQVLLTYADLRPNEQEDHKDPSDHVIISHAMSERMPLISSDRKFVYYLPQGLNLVFNER